MQETGPLAFEAIRRAGRIPVGKFVVCSDPAMTEVVSMAGFDFAIYDCEHSPNGPAEVLAHVRAAEIVGLIPLVRVWDPSGPYVQKFLDVGVSGIVVPHVEDPAVMAEVVRAVRFPPDGVRGMSGSVHALNYDGTRWDAYKAAQRDGVLVIPIIESVAGVANIDKIAAVDGVNYLFFGPGDYSNEAGVALDDEAVGEAWKKVAAAAKAQGKTAMTVPYIFPGFSPKDIGALVYGMDLGSAGMLMRADLNQLQQRLETSPQPEGV